MTSLLVAIAAVAVASFLLSPKVRTADGFFRGTSDDGRAPGLLTLTLSQVTTWIFARSLMNAAILGFYYGIAGALAYAAYYLSFLTGGLIVDRLRFRHGAGSVQEFLSDHYGAMGRWSYNVVVGVRLLSEVFANLLVIGIIFGAAGTTGYTLAIVAVAVLTLGYSMMGGLRAALRTDVMQTAVLYAGLAVLLALTFTRPEFDPAAVLASSAEAGGPGWVLLAVALLQIWSYPLHDPVMMDRGFLADRDVTRRSFLNAAWISVLGIMVFGVIGIYAGLNKAEGEAMVAVLTRLLGEPAMVLFNLALVVSAVSTLDSTFASASKLVVADMGIVAPSVRNGRLAMAGFLLGGLAFLFLGNKDLFAAVAVSGTASMFLAPVVFFNILGGRRVQPWAFAFAFALAIAGGALYMLEAGGHVAVVEPLLGITHKYAKLLAICIAVLAGGCGAFALGAMGAVRSRAAA
ncbi:MAG: sodium:proline symporter [Rhodospirillales bacterium CG15_BIG_FIL_POST_REV_8_21_14_020_66_15]|nr:MAG: sodium:proline symporter [Rhodospirillales bacterium CG15_BIG_FIL_POST_REV_8_21_14_020_66_15]